MKQGKYNYETPFLSVIVLDDGDVIRTSVVTQGDREGQSDFFDDQVE